MTEYNFIWWHLITFYKKLLHWKLSEDNVEVVESAQVEKYSAYVAKFLNSLFDFFLLLLKMNQNISLNNLMSLSALLIFHCCRLQAMNFTLVCNSTEIYNALTIWCFYFEYPWFLICLKFINSFSWGRFIFEAYLHFLVLCPIIMGQ